MPLMLQDNAQFNWCSMRLWREREREEIEAKKIMSVHKKTVSDNEYST